MKFVREVSRRLDESKRDLGKRMGDLSNRFGELAGHLVAPSINRKLCVICAKIF
jgi:hypothetical protein